MIYELQIATAAEENLLLEEFSQRFCWLRERGYLLGVSRVANEQSNTLFVNLKLQGNNNDLFLKEDDIIYIFKHQISEFLAEHILRDWEEKILFKEINKKSRRISPEDQKIVLYKAVDFLRRCNGNESLNLLLNYGRKNKISHKIMDYIYSNNTLVIEGLITFCMPDYLNELRFAVDMACEELRNEKEYNDFVKLLRYFVDTQIPRLHEVNLLMDKDGLFYIWDGDGVNIHEKFSDYYCNDILINDISLDDMLVSILITVSPQQIILHNAGKQDTEPVKMIREVFAERIKDCNGCERCLPNGPDNDWKNHN